VPRNTTPDPDPIVQLLDSEDVVSLIGFVGTGRTTPGGQGAQPALRIHSGRSLQRWIEIPQEAVIHSQQIDPTDPLTRSVVWVQREVMDEPMVTDEAFAAILAALEQAPLSAWNLIPETRLVAAGLIGLIRDADADEGGSQP
jgi:hypothetical protein